MDDDRFSLPRRLAAAAPDAALAGLYLWCWIEPLAWRKTLVAELMLVMLVEFLVIHSGPFLGILVMGEDSGTSRATRLKMLFGLVITSYSIHYTKLYEACPCRESSPGRSAR